MKKIAFSFLILFITFFISSCQGGGSGLKDVETRNFKVKLFDDYIKDAIVKDSENQIATYEGKGVYAFAQKPQKTITLEGGYFEQTNTKNEMKLIINANENTISPIHTFYYKNPDKKEIITKALNNEIEKSKLSKIIYILDINNLSSEFAKQIPSKTSFNSLVNQAKTISQRSQNKLFIHTFISAVVSSFYDINDPKTIENISKDAKKAYIEKNDINIILKINNQIYNNYDTVNINVGKNINFDASKSSDENAKIIKYEWFEKNTLLSNKKSFTKSDFQVGQHEIKLKITNDNSEYKSIMIKLNITNPTMSLKADASADKTAIFGNMVTLDASNSTGNILTYEWSENTNILSTNKIFSTNKFALGVHDIILKVTDINGLVKKDSVKINIIKANSLIFNARIGANTAGFHQEKRTNFNQGIAIDNNGNIFVTHQQTSKILKFNSNFKYLKSFGKLGHANDELSKITSIDINTDILNNRIYVVDMGNNNIKKFDLQGNYISTINDTNLQNPYDIAINNSSNEFFVANKNAMIIHFDALGAYKNKINIGNAARGIAYHDNKIFITNENNITKYSLSTNNIVDTFSSGDKNFNSPKDIQADNQGNLYVADTGNSIIQKYNAATNSWTSWGEKGSKNGEFYSPVSIKYYNNHIYVVDGVNQTLQKFDTNGNFINKFGMGGHENGKFILPTGIAIDDNDNIYVADQGNYRIQKFNANARFVTSWGKKGQDDDEFGDNLMGLAIKNGYIYVVDNSNKKVKKFDLNGNLITSFNNNKFSTQMGGIAVDKDEKVYVCIYDKNQVYVFNKDGSDNKIFYIKSPTGIYIDKNNLVYVSSQTDNKIIKINLDDNSSTTLINQNLNKPAGISVDSVGNIYVVNEGDNSVKMFDKNANLQLTYGGFGNEDGKLMKPTSIAINQKGEIFITDTQNFTIEKIILN